MDPPPEQTYGSMKILGKRVFSSEFSAQAQDDLRHEIMSTGGPHTAAHLDGFDPKRPRLSRPGPGHIRDDRRKATSSRDRSRLGDLPNEILQHIFSFVDPISLARLIRVSHSFRSLIDPALPLPQASSQAEHLPIRSQDQVWAISRKTFLQGFPKPMDAMNELEMWRLALGRRCQYCKRKARHGEPLPALSPWSAGPGMENVRTIWPFRVRSCGRCLAPRLIKETDLLVSGSSALLPGLPFAIFTPSLDYVPSVTLRQMSAPSSLQLTKFYFKPQLEELQSRRDSAQALGIAALEEWYKGLEDSGQQHNANAARFDQWELQGSWWKALPVESRNPSDVGFFSHGMHVSQAERVLPRQSGQRDTPIRSFGDNSPGSLNLGAIRQRGPITTQPQPTNEATFTVSHGIGGPTASVENPIGSIPVQPFQRHRVERSLKEVEQAKADRRKEIERRCQGLDPPIMPSTLTFMEAFKAAILISQPLNDRAWETLMPRLLAQRSDAEQRERLHNASLNNPMMPIEGRRLLEEEQRVAHENASRMWFELKIPSRDKIQKYAQEFIHQTWSDGRGVTRATASKFAAEVLCYVRQRFDEVIVQEDRMLALKGTAFPQDADSQACRKLKLEDMKWTFEEYVKPHTERFGKDLFLCRVCDANQKLFSFEAVIQHYAAKHTSALSHGNAVVYWKAPWPVDPPFDPSPNIPWVREGLQNSGQPTTSSQLPMNPGYAATGGFRNHIEEVAGLVLEFWHRLDGVWDLSDPVRLYVVIQHVNLRFLREFNDELSLTLFTDTVLQRPELHSLREILGLRCKMCSQFSRSTPAQSAAFNGRSGAGRFLPELLIHFLHDHLHSDRTSIETGAHLLSSRAPTKADWKRDMLWLPSPAVIQALLHSPGIDRDKLQLISDAFPDYLPHPLPYVAPLPPIRSQGEHQTLRGNIARYYDHKGAFTGRGSVRGSGDGSYIATSEESGITAEDEYDPHRPAPTFKRPHPQKSRYTMYSPPQDHIGYRDLPSYRTRSPAYREYNFRDADHSPAWDLHSREGPLSGASMVYSHEDGSSRFSYLEPLNRSSETTVEGASDAVPGSKPASRRSLPSVADTEAPGIYGNSEGRRSRGDELVSNAAADFLDNFDPTHGENVAGPGIDIGVLHVRQTEQNHLDSAHHWTTARHSLENPPAPRPSTGLSDPHPPNYRRHTPSLPIRQTGRPGLTSDYQEPNGPGSPFLEGKGSGTSRVLVAEHEFMSDLPEGSHRVPFQSTGGTVHDRAGRVGSQYESRYYSEDDYYSQGGTRYELIDTIPAEASRRPIDSVPPRYIDSHGLHGQGYDDSHRRYPHGGSSHEGFVRAAPRGYPPTYGAGSQLERHIEYSGYEDRYAGEDRFAPRPRVWTVAENNGEVIYESLDRPTRFTPR